MTHSDFSESSLYLTCQAGAVCSPVSPKYPSKSNLSCSDLLETVFLPFRSCFFLTLPSHVNEAHLLAPELQAVQ